MSGDIRHHKQFLKSILEHRRQNMTVVRNKFDAFFSNFFRAMCERS